MKKEKHDEIKQIADSLFHYGRITVQNLFLLNGAAILAFLTFIASLLQHRPEIHPSAFVGGLWAFICGTMFAILAAAASYLHFRYHYDAKSDREASESFAIRFTDWFARLAAVSSGVSFLIGAALITAALGKL